MPLGDKTFLSASKRAQEEGTLIAHKQPQNIPEVVPREALAFFSRG